MAFGSEEEEHKYIKDLEKTGLKTTDIDPFDPKQPKNIKRQKTDPTYNVSEDAIKSSTIWNTPKKTFKTIDEHIAYVTKLEEIDWSAKLDLIDNYLINSQISESKTTNARRQVEALVNSFNSKPKLNEKYIPVMVLLVGDRVHFYDVNNEFPAKNLARFGELVDIKKNSVSLKFGKEIRQFPNDIHRTLSMTTTMLINSVNQYDKLQNYVSLAFEQQLPDIMINEASGYIPSEKQKNDPRFSTALTVDVHPDSIKKNAKAFGWLTNRAGVPPTAKASGKI
jgi:hypothetical protein